jgi:acyl transferase domain-containing protein
VSSFGFGGSNAHAILEEAPLPRARPAGPERPLHPFVLSARSDAALRSLAARHAAHLAGLPEEALPDVCHTANAGRASFPHRFATTARTLAELRAKLEAFARGQEAPGVHVGACRPGARPPRVAFAFAGEPSSHAATGLVEVWRSFGVAPDAVAGHGLGEHAAAFVVEIGPGGDAWEVLLDGLARFFALGGEPDWRAVDRDFPRRIVSLPTYPFERRRCRLPSSELRTFTAEEAQT